MVALLPRSHQAADRAVGENASGQRRVNHDVIAMASPEKGSKSLRGLPRRRHPILVLLSQMIVKCPFSLGKPFCVT